MAGVGGRPGRPAGALRGRLHLRGGLAGLQWARVGDAAPGHALLDPEPVSIAFASCPSAVTKTGLRVCSTGEGAECALWAGRFVGGRVEVTRGSSGERTLPQGFEGERDSGEEACLVREDEEHE